MLSLFPELLFLSPFAALFVRVTIASVFAYSAYVRARGEMTRLKVFGVIDGVIALLLLIGFSTQLAALAGTLCLAFWLWKNDMSPVVRSTAALALVMALTLIITGAGPFAFDLPL